MNKREEVIKIGKAKYDNSIEYKVRILKTNFKPGSGDCRDVPEISNDRYGVFYEIQYLSLDGNELLSIGGWYDTLEEAINIAELKTSGIVWD